MDKFKIIILIAVLFQAFGKVLYSTYLKNFPTLLFVLISFTLTFIFFLLISNKSNKELSQIKKLNKSNLSNLIILNIGTAITFISFFNALKLINPSAVSTIELGVSPVILLIIHYFVYKIEPKKYQVIVCTGILAGCMLLSFSVFQDSHSVNQSSITLGIMLSIAAGAGMVCITLSSKNLLNQGWRLSSVLAHRFYIIIPFCFLLTVQNYDFSIEWNGLLIIKLAIISIINTIVPFYLYQIGIQKCGSYQVIITMSLLPVITLVIELFFPDYQMSVYKLSGILITTFFIIYDTKKSHTRLLQNA